MKNKYTARSRKERFKERNQELVDFAKRAREQGLTYGELSALENAPKITRRKKESENFTLDA